VEDGTETTDGHDEDEDQGATLADVVDQLADLTAQMKKLTKAVRRSTDTDRKKPKKRKASKN
jgi:hypothetical protein